MKLNCFNATIAEKAFNLSAIIGLRCRRFIDRLQLQEICVVCLIKLIIDIDYVSTATDRRDVSLTLFGGPFMLSHIYIYCKGFLLIMIYDSIEPLCLIAYEQHKARFTPVIKNGIKN